MFFLFKMDWSRYGAAGFWLTYAKVVCGVLGFIFMYLGM